MREIKRTRERENERELEPETDIRKKMYYT